MRPRRKGGGGGWKKKQGTVGADLFVSRISVVRGRLCRNIHTPAALEPRPTARRRSPARRRPAPSATAIAAPFCVCAAFGNQPRSAPPSGARVALFVLRSGVGDCTYVCCGDVSLRLFGAQVRLPPMPAASFGGAVARRRRAGAARKKCLAPRLPPFSRAAHPQPVAVEREHQCISWDLYQLNDQLPRRVLIFGFQAPPRLFCGALPPSLPHRHRHRHRHQKTMLLVRLRDEEEEDESNRPQRVTRARRALVTCFW